MTSAVGRDARDMRGGQCREHAFVAVDLKGRQLAHEERLINCIGKRSVEVVLFSIGFLQWSRRHVNEVGTNVAE